MAPAVVRILRRCVANTSQVLVQLASSLQTSRGSLKPTGATRTVDAAGQAWGQIAEAIHELRSSIQHVTRQTTVALNLGYFALVG